LSTLNDYVFTQSNTSASKLWRHMCKLTSIRPIS